ncbi:MAG: hypothetical protein IJB51_04560, partial [Clostridia bacterium]|nr:hypothetical protein [Clostridia bacterium]
RFTNRPPPMVRRPTGYVVGADAHIGPPRAACGMGNGFVQNQIRRTDGADGGTGNPSPTMGNLPGTA